MTHAFRMLVATIVLPMAVTIMRAQPAAAPRAAAGAPNTDIYLARISMRGGTLQVDAPRNLTQREGYDNQPSFAADGRSIFYTRREPNALLANTERDVQTDIWRIAVDGSTNAPVAVTAESEYSAQLTDDGSSITVVRVERDSAQHLWRFPLRAGVAPERLVGRVKPVGYYAWNGPQVVMFVLGAPATLQLMDTISGRIDTIARDIGRGVKRVPGTARVTFVQKAGATWFIDELDLQTRRVTRLVETLPNQEEYTWIDGATMLAASGTTLRTFTRGGRGWTQVADLASANLADISRVSVDPAGQWLAFVAVPQSVRARP